MEVADTVISNKLFTTVKVRYYANILSRDIMRYCELYVFNIYIREIVIHCIYDLYHKQEPPVGNSSYVSHSLSFSTLLTNTFDQTMK